VKLRSYYASFIVWKFILNLFNIKSYKFVTCVTKLEIKFCKAQYSRKK